MTPPAQTPQPRAEREALERYLRRATRGLWGQRRREVRAELEEHVLEQAWVYEREGLDTREALARALETLGEARALSAGLTRVHSGPALARGALLAVALAGGAVALFANRPPSVAALQSIEPAMLENLQGLRLDDLQASLGPLGVGVEAFADRAIVRFPDARGPIRLEVTAEDFVTTPEFVQAVAHAPGATVDLAGWDNPRLSVGTTAFTLGTPDTPVTGYGLYAELIGARLTTGERWGFAGYSVVRFSSEAPARHGYHPHRLRVTAAPGTVVAAVSAPGQRGSSLRFIEVDVAPVQPDGTVLVYLPYPAVAFARGLRDLEAKGQGVALLELSGRVTARGPEYAVIQPAPP